MAEDSKAKVIVTDSLIIRGHLLRCFNAVIQISNISSLSMENLPLPRFPMLAGVLTAVGILLMGYGEAHNKAGEMGFGGCILFVCGMLIVGWRIDCHDKKKQQYLRVRMNSGDAYYIFYRNQEFAGKVLQVLANVIEKGATPQTDFLIDMRECEIRENGNVVHVSEGTR